MEEFIKSVTDQIRCVRARAGVAKELFDHIEDQAAAYEEEGELHEEAVRRAVREMGDPVEVGVELDRIHRPQTDFKMIGMAFAFSAAGFFVLCGVNGLTHYPEYLIKQCLVVFLSFGVMAGMYFLDYSFVGRYAYGIYVLVTIVTFIGSMYAARGGMVPRTFMLSYLYVPVYAGILYRLRGGAYGALVWGIVIQMVNAVFVLTFSSTLYTTLNVYMICAVLLILAIRKRWFAVDRKKAAFIVIGALFGLPTVLLIGRGVLFGAAYGFQTMRLQAWLHPEKYAEGAGYLYQFIRQELSSAKFIGPSDSIFVKKEGVTQGAKAWLIGAPIPYPTEPFVLLQLICNYGILAGLAMVAAFSAVVIRAFCIVKNQKNQLGFMISAACFMVFLINCLEGVLINTGYCLVNSMQLPFVSDGVCTAITYAILIGLLLTVHRNERIITDETIRRPAWRLSIKWEKR
ncbi:MAG: FtsW/RodA/SpoVE family cell cycle protein [Lachnospiraceae bacterium]|nr:FtsW/RodA/SpoVE family cell cycle protein [Lachnospiraceae bacterium]